MVRYKNLEVICSCGTPIAHYKKGGSGRLRKMYFERILTDDSALLPRLEVSQVGTDILCLGCTSRIGTVGVVRGKYALKINQGVVRC